MNESKDKNQAQSHNLRSSLVTLTVEPGDAGYGRIILDGIYMDNTGFHPGDAVEAIVQSGLISILRAE